MTTDPEEGRRQIEAMKPEPLKVGDKVRLKAGGEQVMTVGVVTDDGEVVCRWHETSEEGWERLHTCSFPAISLVRVDPT